MATLHKGDDGNYDDYDNNDTRIITFSVAQQPNSGPGRRNVEISRSYKLNTHTQKHPVGLLSTNDQLVAEAATYIKHNQTKGAKHPCPQRNRRRRSQHARDRGLAPDRAQRHWDRPTGMNEQLQKMEPVQMASLTSLRINN